MRKINIGLIGYGTVGAGLVQFFKKKRRYIKEKYAAEFVFTIICDLDIRKKDTKHLTKATILTTKIDDVLDNKQVDVIVELIGGLTAAKDLVERALKQGTHVVTANKALIAHSGKNLFALAQKNNCRLLYESSVLAGVPIIKTITEGIAGNTFNGIYGIVNGTCNYILTQMSKNNCSFADALKSAQELGFAETDPTLDINGMDTSNKLAILVYLAFGKFIHVKDVYTEGITDISAIDIEHAESLGLTIKLLAIAKKKDGNIEARVHPTLISKDHPLASTNGIYNAVFLDSNPLGHVLLSGEGAGALAAASGVVSDLINLASSDHQAGKLANYYGEDKSLCMSKIDQVETKFYIRFQAIDQPGVLSKIAGILGRHNIGINSVTQKKHNDATFVPLIMLTDFTSEKNIRTALKEINKLSIVKNKPVAIRMENLS
ncbi:homoserine dehydrogenase [Candidatus Omnitrophota bacterium]